MYKDVMAERKNSQLCPLTTAMLNTIPGEILGGFVGDDSITEYTK